MRYLDIEEQVPRLPFPGDLPERLELKLMKSLMHDESENGALRVDQATDLFRH
jgi:hypothetical protein